MKPNNNSIKRRPGQRTSRPSLRFSPFAWAKLLYLRDCGPTKIGGFGLSAEDDPLLVTDVLLLQQLCSPVTVVFSDTAVADLFDSLVDQQIHPARFGRIWIHTHPGDCPQPSSTDEETFDRVFGRTDWSVMAIVARSDAAYARLSFHVGPGGALEIPMRVDYSQPFGGADWGAWEREYAGNVMEEMADAPAAARDILDDRFLDHLRKTFFDQEEFYDGTSEVRPV